MTRLKGGLSGLLLSFSLLNGAIGWKVNTTIYDTDARIAYTPQDDICVQRSHYIPWRGCNTWIKPWESAVYRSQGKLATFHRSLDHEQPSMTLTFQGSAIWLYGPPRSQLPAIPVDHKICLHESHRVASNIISCYRVDVAEAYSTAEDYDAPVVIFAKGGLRDQEHQIVISVGDSVGEDDKHQGIQFSHAVYTIDRPTEWTTNEDSWRFREVVMHNTHPLLSYSPKEPISSRLWPWSPDPSGWSSKTYTAEDGSRVSWHELKSRGESNQDEWGVDATVTAGVVAIYGVPKAHIGADSLSDVCVRIDSGPCEIVDVKHAYLNAGHHEEVVLLWQNQALESYRETHISVRLVKTSDSNVKVFPFKAIRYLEQQEYSSPDPLVGRVENVAVAHDGEPIVYHPARRCVRYSDWWCSKWFSPWVSKEAGSPESVLTYHSTVSSYRTTENPSATFNFQGSAVYVYGAPKSLLKNGFASQHICLNDTCHVVDAEQAYLNAPGASAKTATPLSVGNAALMSATSTELDPVLIWSMTGLDDLAQHSLRLALAELPSADKAEMSIAKIVYTKVSYKYGQSRPDVPAPRPDRTYAGPVYPPHAMEWELRSPPTLPPNPIPPHKGVPRWGYSLGTLVLISVCVYWVIPRRDHPERGPIRPNTPPPPYVPPQDRNNPGPCPGFNATDQGSATSRTNYPRSNQAGIKFATA